MLPSDTSVRPDSKLMIVKDIAAAETAKVGLEELQRGDKRARKAAEKEKRKAGAWDSNLNIVKTFGLATRQISLMESTKTKGLPLNDLL